MAFHKKIENNITRSNNLGGDLTFGDSSEPQEYIIEKEEKGIKFSNDKDEDIVDGTWFLTISILMIILKMVEIIRSQRMFLINFLY